MKPEDKTFFDRLEALIARNRGCDVMFVNPRFKDRMAALARDPEVGGHVDFGVAGEFRYAGVRVLEHEAKTIVFARFVETIDQGAAFPETIGPREPRRRSLYETSPVLGMMLARLLSGVMVDRTYLSLALINLAYSRMGLLGVDFDAYGDALLVGEVASLIAAGRASMASEAIRTLLADLPPVQVGPPAEQVQ